VKLAPRRRTRLELDALAVEIATRRFGRPVVAQTEIRHDSDCPLLAGSTWCKCSPEFHIAELAA
jgi:hypothetical protein